MEVLCCRQRRGIGLHLEMALMQPRVARVDDVGEEQERDRHEQGDYHENGALLVERAWTEVRGHLHEHPAA